MEDNRQTRMDAQVKRAIDARTKEFKEKLAKLTYEKIKQTLVPSKEPLKGYPHNESVEEESDSKEYQVDLDMLSKLVKGDPKKAAAFIKRTASLTKGGGWNMAQKPSKKQKAQWNKMVGDHMKKHRALYASYNEEAELEVTISMDESINEAVKAKSGKGVADIDYVGDKKLTSKIEKMFKIKIKQTGNTTADVTGQKKDIVNFLTKHYYYDDSDIKDMYSDLVEESELEEMNARYEISDMEQSKDPAVKREYAKLKKAKYPSMQYIRQYKEVEAALDKSLPANKRKK